MSGPCAAVCVLTMAGSWRLLQQVFVFAALMLKLVHSEPDNEVSISTDTEWSVPDATFEEVTEAQNDAMPVLLLIYRATGNVIEQRNSEYALPMWDMVAHKLSGIQSQRTATISAAGGKKFAKWWQNLERGRSAQDLGKLMIRKVGVSPGNQQKVVDTFQVEHIPEVVLIGDDGGNVHYNGRLKSQLIVNWANWLLNRTHPLHSVADLDTFLHGSGLAVVGLFENENMPEAVSFSAAGRHPSILKRNVAMAVAYGQQLSSKMAERLQYHMRLRCIAFTVGPSSSRQISLPLQTRGNASWECSSAMLDPRGLAYGENASPQFTARVMDGKRLIVSRTDASADMGWIRHLHLKCCAAQPEAKEVEDIIMPTVIMLTPSDSFVLRSIPDAEGIRQWVHEGAVNYDGTLAIELDDANYDVIFDPERTFIPVLLVVPSRGTPGEAIRSLLDTVVPELQGRVVCAVLRPGPVLELLEEHWELPTVQADEEEMQNGSSKIEPDVEAGHDIWSIRTGVYLLDQSDWQSRRKFKLEGEVTKDTLLKFVADYETGRLQTMIRTEPLPSAESNYTGPIRNLVGSTFADFTQNAAWDVAVYLYAPWCGHCQRFKKTYTRLAASLHHVLTLQFAQMDGTRNEAGEYQMPSYPSVILFPAGSRKHEVASFSGVRSLEHVRSWLHEHCTHKFEVKAPATSSASMEIPSDGLLHAADDGPGNDL